MSTGTQTKLAPGGGGGAWKSFEEISGKMSTAELASEKRRRDIGLFLGPLLFVLFLLIPMPVGLTFKANLSLGITAWVMAWWICEPIPMPATSLLGCALVALCHVLPVNVVLPILGHTNTWYLIGTFIFMNAMVKHGFVSRVAYWLLSRPIGRTGPNNLLSLYIFAVAAVSAWLSNMATTMLFLAITTGMMHALKIEDGHIMSRALKLGSGFSSQAGGFATPMGAAGTNFLTIGLIVTLTKYQFTVASWMYVGIPFMLIMTVIMIAYFRFMFKIELPNYQAACDFAAKELKALGPMTSGEKRAVAITVLVVILWIIPDFLTAIAGRNAPVTLAAQRGLDSAIVAVLGAVLCFVVPENWSKRKAIMNWTESVRYIDWGALLLVVCGLVLGAALAAKDVGILAWVSKSVAAVLGNYPPFIAVLGITALAVVLTQFIPNIPAIAIMLPVSYSIATALHLNPVALMLTVGFACQQSYATPVAAPQMAFVYGAGGISIKQFIKAGSGISIISIPVTSVICYYLAAAIFRM